MDYLKKLSSEPIFWSRIGMAEDPTGLDENGNIKFYSPDWSEYINEHKSFLEKGVKIHTSIMHNGWIDADTLDFSAIDKTLDAICSISEDICYMPRIKLNAPIKWCLINPKEVWLTENAPKTDEEICSLINKLEPFYATFGLKRTAPFEAGWAGLQSFASEKWFHDASDVLRKVVQHVENSKYGKQIIGYHIGFGQCAENVQWGTWYSSEYWGDFSECNRKSFEKFSGFTKIPSVQKRCHTPKNLKDFFRVGNDESIAYSKYNSDLVATRLCEFAEVIKSCVNKPVGTFYGYVFSSYTPEIGHTAIDKLLDCPHIDFIASPKAYYRSGPGEPGGSQATSMSVMKKKLWLDELDNGSHLGNNTHSEEKHPKTLSETTTLLRREVVKNLTWGNQNFWWMDLGGGWFNHKDIMAEIEKLVGFTACTRKKQYKSVSEILFVVDNVSLDYHNCDSHLMGAQGAGLCNEMLAELRLIGAPIDECRLSDLTDMDLSGYKMIVFANAFCIDHELCKIIKNTKAVCIWHYAPGIRNPLYNPENVKTLTGMAIKELNCNFHLCNDYGIDAKLPPVYIDSEADEIISTYPSGKIKIAKKNNHILSCSYSMRASDFRNIATDAGVKMYAPANCTVYADNRIIGIFPRENISGLLSLPSGDQLTDVFSGETYINNQETNFKAKNAMVFNR